MSVNFCARAVTEALEAKVRADPDLATTLASQHDAVDFDRAEHIARMEAEIRPRPLPPRVLARADQLEAEHAKLWAAFAAKGIAPRDVDATIELHRAYNGLAWGWSGTAAARLLFDDGGGTKLGDDVGYGPARLLSNRELGTAVAAIEGVDVAAFAARYREGCVAWARTAGHAMSILDEHDDFANVAFAFRRLVPYLRDASLASRALLVWFE